MSERIIEEKQLILNYGLGNGKGIGGHREIWKARSKLRRWRRNAMKLIGRVDSTEGHFAREKEDLIHSLQRRGLLGDGAQIDDVLRLSVDHVLARRLQSQVYFKGLASSMSQARQLLVHNHISIGDQVTTVPGYIISRTDEEQLNYHSNSPLSNASHPLREEIEARRATATYGEEPETPSGPGEPEQDDLVELSEAAAAAPSAEDTVAGGEA
jgi:small subunit ribosomal protein S4